MQIRRARQSYVERQRLSIQDDVGGKSGEQGASRRIAGGTGRGLHAVILQDRHFRPGDTNLIQPSPNGVGKDAGRDRHPEVKARLESNIKIGQRE